MIQLYNKDLEDALLVSFDGKKLPLAIKLKNLGCVRYSPCNTWIGQVGRYKGFCRFSTFKFGVRAVVMLLMRYVYVYHLNDIWDILNRYSPVSDGNNVGNYYKSVVADCGFDILSNNIEILRCQIQMLVYAITCVECGNDFKVYVSNSKFFQYLLNVADAAFQEYLDNVIFSSIGKVDKLP